MGEYERQTRAGNSTRTDVERHSSAIRPRRPTPARAALLSRPAPCWSEEATPQTASARCEGGGVGKLRVADPDVGLPGVWRPRGDDEAAKPTRKLGLQVYARGLRPRYGRPPTRPEGGAVDCPTQHTARNAFPRRPPTVACRQWGDGLGGVRADTRRSMVVTSGVCQRVPARGTRFHLSAIRSIPLNPNPLAARASTTAHEPVAVRPV